MRQVHIDAIKKYVLTKLNLPCVPRGPPETASFNMDLTILQQLMQNQTESDSEDLLKRAQSFYPTCKIIHPCSWVCYE